MSKYRSNSHSMPVFLSGLAILLPLSARVSQLLSEPLTIGTRGQQGISFISCGQAPSQ